MTDLQQHFQHWAEILSDQTGDATIVRIREQDCLYEYDTGIDVFRGWLRDGESIRDIVWLDEPAGGWPPALSDYGQGGPRPGSGRKPGANWNGSNSYERGIRFSATLRPDLYRWLKQEAKRRGVSMAALVNEAVREMMG